MAQSIESVFGSPQALSLSELVEALGSDPENGLTEKKARSRRKHFGSNHIRNAIEIRFSHSLKTQCKGLTNLFSLLTMFLFYLFEQETVYLLGFFLSLFLMILGALAESSAARLLNLPSRYAALSVQVIREGIEKTVDSRTLAPGDVILLQKGCLIPADARILSDDGWLTALETPVSGKKNSVPKTCRATAGEDEAIAPNMLYAGTILTGGSCRAMVCRTGKYTTTRLLHSGQKEYIPLLLRRVQELCHALSLLSLAAIPVLTVLCALRGGSLSAVFPLAVLIGGSTLCDSALSIAYLAFGRGMQDMAKDGLIVRNPDRVSRLAQVNTVMCTKELMFPPKRIRMTAIYAGGKLSPTPPSPDAQMQRLLLLSLACSEHPRSRKPYEQVIYRYLKDSCTDLSELTDKWFRMDTETNPDGEVTGILSLHNDRNTVVIKGAPENVLSRCAGYESDGKDYRLNDSARRTILAACETASRENAYLIAIASGITDEDSLRAPGAEHQLIFRGFLAFRLSMEVDIANAVYRCGRAGVEAVVSTADPYYTAASIGRSTGLIEHEGQMISSPEISAQERGMFMLNAPRYKLFLEPDPDQWLDVLLLRKQSGRVVAATASTEEELPLLREADVSVVPARSGDALRASADMLMAETGFHVLADGITDARALCFRLRWLLQYLFAGAATLFFSLVLALLCGTTLPFGVAELLYGGLIVNIALACVLAFLPVDRKLLADPLPVFHRKKRLQSGLRPLVYALGSGVCLSLTAFLTEDPVCSLPAFAFSQFLYACGCLWQEGAFRRKRFGYRLLWAAFPCVAVFVFGILTVPVVNGWLGLHPLGWRQWLLSLGLPAIWQVLVQLGLFLLPLLHKNKKAK